MEQKTNSFQAKAQYQGVIACLVLLLLFVIVLYGLELNSKISISKEIPKSYISSANPGGVIFNSDHYEFMIDRNGSYYRMRSEHPYYNGCKDWVALLSDDREALKEREKKGNRK